MFLSVGAAAHRLLIHTKRLPHEEAAQFLKKYAKSYPIVICICGFSPTALFSASTVTT